ncbi:VOC family protein [Streptomyces fuscigenes]|uniref:VOC family protein n=1 Tax=Streptomyces fuscigenes TaxID=1528880 RepID=UPI001F444507|nr:VOC family protein [Streptomyces fuscigenes]MCF3964439.1 VOC family protein [Streptomyces fuscigenes]
MDTPRMIFVNLPVKDLATSRAFWEKLGFSFNPQFSDDRTACLVISDTIFAMLMDGSRFRDFTEKEIADTSSTREAIIALSASDRAEVDRLVDTALAGGGSPVGETMDQGFMYGRAFLDPEGHHWEVVWMDPAAVEPTR